MEAVTKSVFTPRYQRFVEAMTKARQAAGVTQAELAARLGKPQSFVSKYERSERRLDIVEFLEIVDALGIDPDSVLRHTKALGTESQSIFARWGVTPDELSTHALDNPSLNGLLMGYVAEIKLRQLVDANPLVTESTKADDHDRKNKGDRTIIYKGHRVRIESKSLQSLHVKELDNDTWKGKTQVDASDTTDVTLPDGSSIRTVCLRYGTFDVLAVNCFLFGNRWRWQFCRNRDLRKSGGRKYSEYQRQHLMATMHTVEWPPSPPFRTDLWRLLDEMVENGELPKA